MLGFALLCHAEQPLPGSSVPFGVALREPVGFVAVCEAEDEAVLGDVEGGTRAVTQRFRLLGFVVGDAGGRSVGEMHYRISSDGFERAVRKGERVIWTARSDVQGWRGIHVREDTLENRADIYRHAAWSFSPRRADELDVRIEVDHDLFAPGEPMPLTVHVGHSSAEDVVAWWPLGVQQLEILSDDGQRLHPRKVPAARRERMLLDQDYGAVEITDLAPVYDWLPQGATRSYTILWRGMVRFGSETAPPVELLSNPIQITLRDPATFTWGPEVDGVACGLVTEAYKASMGDLVMFHLGMKSDSTRVDPEAHLYRYLAHDNISISFESRDTGTVFRRVLDMRRAGPQYIPYAEDFVLLRSHPMLLWSVPVRLLHESGEQIPPGTYKITATYEERHAERTSLPPSGPWKMHQGPLVSAPVTLHVYPAEPESVEIRTNSAIELTSGDCCHWIGSRENPTVLRVMRRPGFSFHASAETWAAVRGAPFKRLMSGGGSSTWVDGAVPCLGKEVCDALATGDSVKVRVDVAIYEIADPHPRFLSSARSDSRAVWRGTLETHRP